MLACAALTACSPRGDAIPLEHASAARRRRHLDPRRPRRPTRLRPPHRQPHDGAADLDVDHDRRRRPRPRRRPAATAHDDVPAVEAAAYAVYDMRTGDVPRGQPARRPAARRQPDQAAHRPDGYAAGQPTKVVTAPDGLIVDPEESRIGISLGQELPRDLLIRAMLIVSANDAARALALDIAGGEAQFAELMNQQAAALGLPTPTPSTPPASMPRASSRSANDMTRLGAYLMGNPTFQLTVERTDAMLNGQTIPSTNDLLRQVSTRAPTA